LHAAAVVQRIHLPSAHRLVLVSRKLLTLDQPKDGHLAQNIISGGDHVE
jgi:hypothetical protein